MMTNNRLLHSIGVASMAYRLAKCLRPSDTEFAQEMFILGLVHDVGYEFADDIMQHPMIGAEILARCGYKYSDCVGLHGCHTVDDFSDELYILNVADMCVGADGNSCNMDERLADIMARYGADSLQYQNAVILADRLKSDPRYKLVVIPDSTAK